MNHRINPLPPSLRSTPLLILGASYALSGCGKTVPSEDPSSLQDERVEVPPPERLTTESGAEQGDTQGVVRDEDPPTEEPPTYDPSQEDEPVQEEP